jgi:hypothetical protein
MIDLYVAEVGQNLPAKGRADLEAEIRSLIEDTVEGRAQAAGRPVDEELVAGVLKEFGSPARMAASYLPPRYLIGPRFYPTFMLVMRIVLTLIGVVALVRLGVALTAPGVTLESGGIIFGQRLADFMTSALMTLGNIVFIFAILEWALPKTAALKAEDWDPRSLKKARISEIEPVRPWMLMWEMAMIVAFAMVLNLYPQWLGFGFLNNGQWHWFPALTPAFFRYLPLINISFGLQLALNILLLRAGRWETSTLWLRAGLYVLSIVVLIVLASGPQFINLPFEQAGITGPELARLGNLFYTMFRAALIFAAVMDGIKLVKLIFRLLWKKEQPIVMG